MSLFSKKTVHLGDWKWGSVCSECRYMDFGKIQLCPKCANTRILNDVPLRQVTSTISHWLAYDTVIISFQANIGGEIVTEEQVQI